MNVSKIPKKRCLPPFEVLLMQQRQMQAHVGTRWHKSIVAFAVSRSFALQVALLLQWDMLVS